jgi:hypothetical protein
MNLISWKWVEQQIVVCSKFFKATEIQAQEIQEKVIK